MVGLRRFVVTSAVTLACLAVGCRPSPARTLTGAWRMDTNQPGAGLAEKLDLRLEFAADGQLRATTSLPLIGEFAQTGTWKFLAVEGNLVRLEVKFANTERVAKLDVTVVDDDTIQLVPPSGRIKTVVRLKRVTTHERDKQKEKQK
jgi:hypothetical protein